VGRSVLCAIINVVVMTIIEKIKETPEEHYNFMNDRLKTQNSVIIRKGYFLYLERMKPRYLIFCICSFMVLFFSWYYVICFAGIYNQSAISWVIAGVISLIIDNCIVQVMLPLFVATIRDLAVYRGILIPLYKLLVKIKL